MNLEEASQAECQHYQWLPAWQVTPLKQVNIASCGSWITFFYKLKKGWTTNEILCALNEGRRSQTFWMPTEVLTAVYFDSLFPVKKKKSSIMTLPILKRNVHFRTLKKQENNNRRFIIKNYAWKHCSCFKYICFFNYIQHKQILHFHRGENIPTCNHSLDLSMPY